MSLLFVVHTPIDMTVRRTRAYREFVISRKHRDLVGREADVEQTLAEPQEVRLSRKDPGVLLFYREFALRWLCIVVRREDGSGCLVTAYPADGLKAGETVWIRSR